MMKTNTLKAFFATFALAFATCGFAQEPAQSGRKTAEETASTCTESMTSRLNLTAEQTERIMEINLDFAAKKKEAKDRSAAEEEFTLLYRERDIAVKSVLTAEQFSTWKTDPLEEMKEQREARERNAGTQPEKKISK